MNRLAPALLALCSLATASTADAQAAYNRRADILAVVPSGNPNKPWRVHAVWTPILYTQTPTDLDLSTDMTLSRKNGSGTVKVGEMKWDVVANQGSGAGCGTCTPTCGQGAVNGLAMSLLCISQGAACVCQFPPLTGSFEIDLQPGDSLIVDLAAAPGAAAEQMLGDDQYVYTFTGTPAFWDRSVKKVEWVPSTISPTGFDLKIQWQVAVSGLVKSIIVGPSFEVSTVHGAQQFQLPCGPWFVNPSAKTCGSSALCDAFECGTIHCSSTALKMDCAMYETPIGLVGCTCTTGLMDFVIQGGLFVAASDLSVELKPGPGALPELPGFEDNDLFLGCATKPANQEYGKGKKGSKGVPALHALDLPMLGQPTALELSQALPGAQPILVLGVQSASLNLEGGVLLVDPLLVLPLPLTIGLDGTVTFGGMLPADPSLCGLALFHQMLIIDPAASGPHHLAMSNGLKRTFGN